MMLIAPAPHRPTNPVCFDSRSRRVIISHIMPFLKNNIAVILAFALPILLVIGIALSAYWPSFLSIDYDFVYATCDREADSYYFPYNCANYLNNRYKVENGKLIAVEVPPLLPPKSDRPENDEYLGHISMTPVTRLFRHDSQKNEGREITLAEAQTLKLNGLITSPDGVSVENAYDRGVDFFPFFGGSSQYGYYLTKGNKRQKLNLVGDDDQYYYGRDNFKFIGWIEKDPLESVYNNKIKGI
ncbi:MAG: hypothetical protein HY481_01250 [Candidatus Vogelbacteria bacterium]|nr:hypothetical protein [Candidatus Vogelbacteria bacterium]